MIFGIVVSNIQHSGNLKKSSVMLLRIKILIGLAIMMAQFSCSSTDRESESHEGKMSGDVKLLYLNPADNWTAGFPIGNGFLGAMVMGGIEHKGLL